MCAIVILGIILFIRVRGWHIRTSVLVVIYPDQGSFTVPSMVIVEPCRIPKLFAGDVIIGTDGAILSTITVMLVACPSLPAASFAVTDKS